MPEPPRRTLVLHTRSQMAETMDKTRTGIGGPKSVEGKSISSQNRNDHGMCQERLLLLPGESPEAFSALREMWRKQYETPETHEPEQPGIDCLVDNLAERDWLQQRCVRRICQLEYDLAMAEANRDNTAIDRLEKRLQNAMRYKTAAENSFARALRSLEQFRKVRVVEDHREWRLQLMQEKIMTGIGFLEAKYGVHEQSPTAEEPSHEQVSGTQPNHASPETGRPRKLSKIESPERS